MEYLPAREWAVIYRNLKPLLRPCGDLGEGRLDFYHRSLSKAVRKRLVHDVLHVVSFKDIRENLPSKPDLFECSYHFPVSQLSGSVKNQRYFD